MEVELEDGTVEELPFGLVRLQESRAQWPSKILKTLPMMWEIHGNSLPSMVLTMVFTMVSMVFTIVTMVFTMVSLVFDMGFGVHFLAGLHRGARGPGRVRGRRWAPIHPMRKRNCAGRTQPGGETLI